MNLDDYGLNCWHTTPGIPKQYFLINSAPIIQDVPRSLDISCYYHGLSIFDARYFSPQRDGTDSRLSFFNYYCTNSIKVHYSDLTGQNIVRYFLMTDYVWPQSEPQYSQFNHAIAKLKELISI